MTITAETITHGYEAIEREGASEKRAETILPFNFLIDPRIVSTMDSFFAQTMTKVLVVPDEIANTPLVDYINRLQLAKEGSYHFIASLFGARTFLMDFEREPIVEVKEEEKNNGLFYDVSVRLPALPLAAAKQRLQQAFYTDAITLADTVLAQYAKYFELIKDAVRDRRLSK